MRCYPGVDGEGDCWCAWATFHLISAVLVRRVPVPLRTGDGLGSRAAAMVLAAMLSCAAAGASAQPVELVAGGIWSAPTKSGNWRAVLAIDDRGAITGRVIFEGFHELPEATVTATWSGGAIRQGFLFRPGTLARLGRLRGALHVNGVKDEWSLRDGTTVAWKLHSIQSTREKVQPELAGQLLARG